MAVPGGTSAPHRKAAPVDLTPEMVRTLGYRASPISRTPKFRERRSAGRNQTGDTRIMMPAASLRTQVGFSKLGCYEMPISGRLGGPGMTAERLAQLTPREELM